MKKRYGLIWALILLMLLGVGLSGAAEEHAGLFSDLVFTELGYEGFYVPVPVGDGWTGGENIGSRGQFGTAQKMESSGLAIDFQYFSMIVDRFVTEDSLADYFYDYMKFDNDEKVISRDVDIDGHRARLTTFWYNNNDGSFGAHGGIILYAREMRILQVRVYTERHGWTVDQVPEITMDDLERIAGMIRFVPEEAPIRKSDTEITIASDDSPDLVVPSGKTLQLKAVFGNEEVVNAKKENNQVTWEVYDPLTGAESLQAKISGGGLLSAVKGLDGVAEVRVRAKSVSYGSEAEASIRILPPASALTVIPDHVTYYADSGEETLLAATITPDNVPLLGLSWSVSGKGTLELTDNRNGTAVIKPLTAGKCTVTVTEPGGKAGRVKVTILQPVTAVELSTKGNTSPYPGNNISMVAKVLPKDASEKKITWALTTGEEYASITPRGTVKISKQAPAGTQITVTCTASGAPVPVTGTMVITVEERPSKKKDRDKEEEQNETGGTPTATPVPAEEGTVTATPTATPVPTEEGTVTATPTATPAPTEEGTVTATPTATPVPTEEGTVTATPTATPVPTEEGAVTATPTATPAPTDGGAGAETTTKPLAPEDEPPVG